MYYYNGAQWYEQFLQVGQLYRALILLGLVLCLLLDSVSSVVVVLCISLNLFVTFFTLPFSELSLVGFAIDVVDYCPSVLLCDTVGWII